MISRSSQVEGTTPAVSVVVPNYNHARFLRKRLDSILGQTFQDFELILLDDCSTDDSRSILSQYANDPRVRIEFNQANSGSTFKQWNKGVRVARGEFVWIAESDDYADERLLETLVSLLKRDMEVGFAYCRSRRVSDEGRLDGFGDYYLNDVDSSRWASDFCADGSEECRKYFAFGNPVPNASAVVFRRSAYEGVGGADESFGMCGDWKLWAAMALGGKIAYTAEPLNYFRFHDASVRGKTSHAGHVAETIHAVRWVLNEAGRGQSLEAICERHAKSWIPVLLSMHVPLNLKRSILRDVLAIDPHPVRRAIGPTLTAARLKLRRHLCGASAG
jgi:glycosyltransferase involved in cell wall biosynthesis